MLMKKYWVVLKAAVSERGTFRGRGFFCGYGGDGFAHAGLCPQACAGVPASECWKL